ncbi:MAG: hydrogenase expression/formation protein HypE, partial [Planctomycetaceae bacterium]|nr:hydrogenase expression/formation protein HypE [Planctomycetaceae bacterium]
YLDKRHDGAILEMNGSMAFTTDSFVISPVFFPGGDIGELAVNGTVNDLAMCGAVPQFISVSFIIEEGLPFRDLWKILTSIKYACEEAGVMVVTGDTKVVERDKGDKIFINTTGIGNLHKKANIDVSRVKSGDKVIVSDWVATHGVAILSVREGLQFETTIESDTRSLHRPVLSLLDHLGEHIHLLRDPTRGGIATVLNEVARDRNLGVDLNEMSLPVDDQVNAACEMLGLDPLYVANEGVFITIVDASIADQALEILHKDAYCRQAKIIGEMTENHPRQVVATGEIGGKRVVSMMIGEQLPRIC